MTQKRNPYRVMADAIAIADRYVIPLPDDANPAATIQRIHDQLCDMASNFKADVRVLARLKHEIEDADADGGNHPARQSLRNGGDHAEVE